MRYSQQKITKSDRTIALFSSVNVISFNKTNEKTFPFFYFHIDIKKYFVCCIKISCRFCFSLAATHVCNKT